ncbi:MAG TPA: extracellular solute-binding protein [Terriglobales bacterium]|nr:extracellular solute-binding protein [Terriglobales bacterium]
MRHSGTGIFLLSLASILVFLHTIEGSAQEAKSIEAAKQEKQLRIYSLMPATYNQAIADAFTQQYPFARIITYRSRGETLLQRVLDEARAGINNFDVLFIDTYETLAIKRRGLLLHYVSPEARSYRAVDRDPEGYWTDFTNIYIVISYNHQIVPKKHVPADWGNLLDPYWKEKIGLDENEFEWYGSLGYYWGRERMIKFMKALKAQSPQIRSGHTLLAQLNAAGEIPLSINYAGSVDALVKRGAPLSWVKTTRPIIYKSTLLSIAKRTESPHLAKLFVDFCLSNKGQNEVVKAGSAPARPGILADEKNLDLRPIPLEVTRNINRYMKEFRKLFVR